MPRRSYEPSGKAGDGALTILALGCTAGGVAVGLLEGFVSQWFSLFIMFPLMIGITAGSIGAVIVKARNVRMPVIAALIGLVGGVLGQLTVMGDAYMEARSMVGGELGLAEWYELVATAGTSITRGSSKFLVQGVGYHILVAVELVLAGGLGAGIPFVAAREPFCERCRRWYDGHDVLATIDGEKDQLTATKRVLETGDYARALRDGKPVSGQRALLFNVLRCTQCPTADAQLTVKLRVTTKKGEEKVTNQWKSMVTASELGALRAAAPTQSS